MNPTRRSSTDPDALLREMLEEPVVPMAPAPAADLRERVTREITERQARFLQWSRVLRRSALAVAAAACVSLALGALSWWRGKERAVSQIAVAELTGVSGAAEVARDGVERTLLPSARVTLQADEEIRTGPNARARASLATGAVLDIGPDARLHFQPAREGRHGPLRDRIELSAGKIEVQVPKLLGGDEVSVHTEGVTIVVHGTKFSVEHWVGDATGGTRVEVSEGKVAVYAGGQERLLTAGAQWTLPNSVLGSAAAAPTGPTQEATGQVLTGGSASTLAAENALLGSAMQQRRLGHFDRALNMLGDFIARYPQSPLVETARVERLRVFQETGAAGRLRPEAERYLKDYPDGQARQEVSGMLDAVKVHRP
jgi:hypothetical protein